MMIAAPPIQRVAGISGQQVSDNPQTVNVRHDAGRSHHRAFPFVQRRRRIGDSPAHEKVRDRAHQFRDADYLRRTCCSMRRIRIELGITCSTAELLRRLEPEAGLEPATPSLSTITQSCDPSKMLKDGQETASMFLDGNRTRIFSFSRDALTQLSYPVR